MPLLSTSGYATDAYIVYMIKLACENWFFNNQKINFVSLFFNPFIFLCPIIFFQIETFVSLCIYTYGLAGYYPLSYCNSCKLLIVTSIFLYIDQFSILDRTYII